MPAWYTRHMIPDQAGNPRAKQPLEVSDPDRPRDVRAGTKNPPSHERTPDRRQDTIGHETGMRASARAEVTYPGVYVEEIPAGVKPIEGVDTSTAAFVGWAVRGPRISDVLAFTDFERDFGGLDARSYLGYAVKHFFDNGGRRAVVVRLGGTLLTPGTPEFVAALPDAVAALEGTHFNLLCVPGESDPAVLAALQEFCRRRRAFLIADCAPTATAASLAGGPDAALLGPDAANSALYFPWLLASDPMFGGQLRVFPPCGFVAGVLARTDAARGVWKAPAGTGASITGAVDLVHRLTDAEQDALNPRGVNVIRWVHGGPVVWGARTLAGADTAASDWKYIPVRRLALFVEESVSRGTTWAAFEPNAEALWARLRLTIGSFLDHLWRQGALHGSTSKDAFFVRCDASTTSQADIDAGVVNVLVGFAPLKPAEFIVLSVRLVTAAG